MKVEVILIGRKCSNATLSKHDIYRIALQHSERSVYISNVYVWTKDVFWSVMQSVPVSSPFCYGFRSEVDVAENWNDVDALVSLCAGVTQAIPHLACRIVIRDGFGKGNDDAFGSNALTFPLAQVLDEVQEVIDESADLTSDVKWDQLLWLMDNNVRIVKREYASVHFNTSSKTLDGDVLKIVQSHETPLSSVELSLTNKLHTWLESSALDSVQHSSQTFCVSVPPLLAGIMKVIPVSLLNAALLYHHLYYPVMVNKEGGKVDASYTPSSLWCNDRLNEEAEECANVRRSLQVIADELGGSICNNRTVRVVIRGLPLYTYQLVSTWRFPTRSVFINEWSQESLLGAKLSLALERWRSFLSTHQMAENSFQDANFLLLKALSKVYRSCRRRLDRYVGGDMFSVAKLDAYRQWAMKPHSVRFSPPNVEPVATHRGNTDNHFLQFNSVMMSRGQVVHSDSSSSSQRSVSSCSEVDEAVKEVNDAFFEDLHLATASPNGSILKDGVIAEVVQNPIFENTVGIIAGDG